MHQPRSGTVAEETVSFLFPEECIGFQHVFHDLLRLGTVQGQHAERGEFIAFPVFSPCMVKLVQKSKKTVHCGECITAGQHLGESLDAVGVGKGNRAFQTTIGIFHIAHEVFIGFCARGHQNGGRLVL